jgi:5'-3' exonuclease
MNLIIDGHAFLNVAINVTKSVMEKDARIGQKYWVNNLFEDRDMLKEDVRIYFRNFTFNYLNSLASPIGSILEGVHFVLDSKSWRRDYISQFFEKSEFKTESAPSHFKYKGNRKYDEHQYLFFEYFEEKILPHLSENCNLNVYKEPGAEGDDWIAILCESLNGDIFIYSVDQDIKQILYSTNKNISLLVPKQMSKTKKIYTSSTVFSGQVEDEHDSFFSLSESHVFPTFSAIVQNFEERGFTKSEIDPVDEILSKVLLGDKSDNIPRLLKMTQTKVDKIIPLIRENYSTDEIIARLDSLDESFILSLVKHISSVFKIKEEGDLGEIREHLIFNIRIMRLNSKVFPVEILDTLNRFLSNNPPRKFKNKEFNLLKNNLSSL